MVILFSKEEEKTVKKRKRKVICMRNGGKSKAVLPESN
jgi:hypothetical protein